MLDIDHSPEHYLDAGNESFYQTEGLVAARNQLKPGGCFALWSDDQVDDYFNAHLREVFGTSTAYEIEFPSPYRNAISINSVYVAQTEADG